jgi:hypothetical protein
MKKASVFVLFLVVFFFGFSKTAAAQGNLQFNQVIFFDIPYGSTQPFTVPAGKVWKVESVGATSSSCAVWLQNGAGQAVGNLYYVSASNYHPAFPIWLPSSHSGFFAYNLNNCTGARAYVSIIEFNVVP